MKVKTFMTATGTCNRKPIMLLLCQLKGSNINQTKITFWNAYTCQPNRQFSACNQTTTSHLSYIFPLFCPLNRRGGETYCFWCGSRQHWRPLFLVCTLSPEPIGGFRPNLHRYHIGREERSDKILVTLTSSSRSHQHFEIFKLWPKKACLHPISWTKWQILAKLHMD